jgi:hypothetical protein
MACTARVKNARRTVGAAGLRITSMPSLAARSIAASWGAAASKA